MSTIAVLGTFDTKGQEHGFLAEKIRERGHQTLLINVGSHGEPKVQPDVMVEEVAALETDNWQAVAARSDRGECVAVISRAAAKYVAKLAVEGRIQGIVSLGGGGGTAIATAAMRALPIGFPKLMVSTLASGNVAHYVGTTDITMMPAIVDVAGMNRISRVIFSNAAGAICGMVENHQQTAAADKPIIAASMFGNTTECVDTARQLLEKQGYEVLVFHATGSGGKSMETLIASGMVTAVLDITTTEWADELAGGVLSAGPDRLNAAADAKVPTIIVPGCLDMVNFGEPHTVPAQYAGRTFYHHNPQVTLMRINAEESEKLGRILAEKANRHTSPVTILLPRKALSIISAVGKPFYDPVADEALFSSIKRHLRSDIPVIELDMEINDPDFAKACAEALIKNIGASVKS